MMKNLGVFRWKTLENVSIFKYQRNQKYTNEGQKLNKSLWEWMGLYYISAQI